MSATSWTYLIVALVGVFSLALWTAYIAVPAWSAYARLWERLIAAFLSVYVLAAFVLVGAAAGGAVLWFYDEI